METENTKGLAVEAKLVPKLYEKGKQVTNDQMKSCNYSASVPRIRQATGDTCVQCFA